MATEPASTIIGLTTAEQPQVDVQRRIWQLPVFFLGLACAIGAIRTFPPMPDSPADLFQRDLAKLKSLVERRPVDANALSSAIDGVAGKLAEFPDDANVIHYHIASAYMTLAEHGPADQAMKNWAKADSSFSQCKPKDLPDALSQQKHAFRSAKASAALGQGNPLQLISVLANPPSGEDPGERSRLLAETYLRLTPPDVRRARDEFTAYLTGSQRGDPVVAARTKVKLAELCMQTNEFEKARNWLKEVGTAAPSDVQAQAKVYLARLALAENNPQEAVKLYTSVQSIPGLPSDQLAAIRYQTGVGFAALKDDREAASQFQQAMAIGGETGVAAALRLAELDSRDLQARGHRVRTAELLENVVRGVGPRGEFQNTLVTLEDVRRTFEDSIRVAMVEGDFRAALRMANAYTSVAAAHADKARRAEIYETWANSTRRTPENESQLKDAWFKAAEEYLSLANLQPTSAGKADFLRRASLCQQNAGDDAGALRTITLVDSLTDLTPDVLAPLALKKGELLLNTRQFDAAVKAFQTAISAGGPSGTLAQVKMARACMDEGRRQFSAEPEKARRQIELAQNLYAQVANKTYETRQEKEAQQEALYDLGKLLMGQNLTEAESRFRQMIQLMPDGALTEKAKLFLGSCLLLAARGDQRGSVPADAEKKLQEALELFESLTTSNAEFMQSQADIRVVNTLLLLKKYNELHERCGKLAEKYRGKPEELIVYSMQHSAWLRVDRNDQAARIYARMQDAFARIPNEAYTDGMPEFTKAYWTKWLDQMKR